MGGAEFHDGLSSERHTQNLPSVEDAPILAPLAELGLERFQDEVAIDTPLHADGTVDHRALIELAKSLVTTGYRWDSPFFDEHHLYWPRADYGSPTVLLDGGDKRLYIRNTSNPDQRFSAVKEVASEDDEGMPSWVRVSDDECRDDSTFRQLFDLAIFEEFDDVSQQNADLADDFRELSFNKLWVPRRFHRFLHTVTRPVAMPELHVMKKKVRDARRKEYLFQIASNAHTITEKLDRAIEMPLPKGGTILVDKEIRRAYQNPEEMEYRRELFVRQILKHHRMGLIDLADLAPMEVVDRATIERSLGAIASSVMGGELVRTRHSGKALRVDFSGKKVA